MTAKKPHTQKSFPATVTFRPDQEPAVRALQAQRKLSTVCQAAVDDYILLRKTREGIEKYK
jgi:hypothetical protein